VGLGLAALFVSACAASSTFLRNTPPQTTAAVANHPPRSASITALATATPAPTTAPSSLPILTDTDPSTAGVFLGEVCGDTGKVPCVQYTQVYRRTIALGVTYVTWHYDLAYFINKRNLTYWEKNGIIPELTWEPTNISLADINAGLWDSYIKTSANELRNFGYPVFLRPFHEFNSSGYSWGLPNQGADAAADQALIAAWQRVVNLFRARGATNVKFDWCFNAGQLAFGKTNTWDAPASAYPGDSYVDWISFDTYNRGNMTTGKTWYTFDDITNASYKTAVAISATRPIALTEIGTTEWGDGGARKAQWLTQMLYELSQPPATSKYPNLRLLAYEDSDKQGYAYYLQTSNPSYVAWANAIRSTNSSGQLNFRSNASALLNVTVP
jgi:hypothetical protein